MYLWRTAGYYSFLENVGETYKSSLVCQDLGAILKITFLTLE